VAEEDQEQVGVCKSTPLHVIPVLHHCEAEEVHSSSNGRLSEGAGEDKEGKSVGSAEVQEGKGDKRRQKKKKWKLEVIIQTRGELSEGQFRAEMVKLLKQVDRRFDVIVKTMEMQNVLLAHLVAVMEGGRASESVLEEKGMETESLEGSDYETDEEEELEEEKGLEEEEKSECHITVTQCDTEAYQSPSAAPIHFQQCSNHAIMRKASNT